MSNLNEPKRLNIRVSADLNAWLDKKSEEMAIPKSNIATFAIEQYRKETETLANMPMLQEAMMLISEEDVN